MFVFHGSDTIVDSPKILTPSRPLDFGSGFYVTSNMLQAKMWAQKVAFRNNKDEYYVSKYDFNYDKAITELKILDFKNANKEWLDFVCQNRKGNFQGSYDIVIGPVADDNVYRVVNFYENGDIDLETALKKLKTEVLVDQILFHTNKSLEFLEFLGTEKYHE